MMSSSHCSTNIGEMSPIKTENVDSGVDIKTCTSPLAFTVNFDDTNEEEEDRKNNNNNCNTNNKRVLCLKDGITRFSPKNRITCSKTEKSSCSSKKPLDMNKERRGEEVEDDDEGSDTGTYTIDDDEEIESKEDSWNDEKIPTSRDEDWISRWAEEQARQQQKIRHQQRRTTTSNNASPNAPPPFENSDENCRFRRKLPRLPSSNNSNDSKETEDLLKDTLSLVNAMEARIEESSVPDKKSKRLVNKSSTAPSHLSTASSLKNERLLRSSAPNKNTQDPKEIAKISELEAWKRRKNYRPTPLSGTPSKLRASSDGITSTTSEGGRITRAALRQQSSASSHMGKGSSNKKNSGKNSNPNGPGRSTSSMSSKDAEFQAWKRRKNYNPLQAVANSKKKQQVASHSNNVNSSTLSPPRHFDRNNHSNGGSTTDDYENERTLHSLQGLKVSNSNSSVMPPRSASFHYPEGGKLKLSSSLINFSSDEEEEELESLDLDENISSRQIGSGVHGIPSTSSSSQLLLQQHLLQNRSSLLGANKSQSRKLLTELGGGVSSSESNTVRLSSATGLSSGLGGAKSCLTPKSHQKLEALDNLVISTIFSVSTKLCISSQNLLQKVRTSDLELSSIIDTLLYVLDDTDPPVSPSKKTSRELSGTLRNLKKVEQVLQVLERLHADDEDDEPKY